MANKYIVTVDTAANLETLRAANGLINGLEYHDSTNGIRYIATAANALIRIESFWKRTGTVVSPITAGDTMEVAGLLLTTSVYKDEFPPILVAATGAAAPDFIDYTIGGVLVRLYSFDGASTEERLTGSIEYPHDADGLAFDVHVHWATSDSATTGTVKWYFDWCYLPLNGTPVAQTTLTTTYTITANQQYENTMTTIGTITPTGWVKGDKILFNIRRSPTTDTYGADAILYQVASHIGRNKIGD